MRWSHHADEMSLFVALEPDVKDSWFFGLADVCSTWTERHVRFVVASNGLSGRSNSATLQVIVPVSFRFPRLEDEDVFP